MEEKKTKKLDQQSKLLIAAAVVIAVLICYMCVEKVIDINNVKAYEAKIVELQQTIGRLYQDIYLGTDEPGNTDGAGGIDIDADEDYWYNAWSQSNDELNSLYFADEDITDTMAKILFIRGVNKIWSQDIYDLSKYPIADPRVTTEIDGQVYVKRDVLYADFVKEYSKIFTGDMLDESLNDGFKEIDGYLYVAAGGEASGNTAMKVEVTKVSESNGEFTYSVKYELSGSPSEDFRYATIVIKAVGNGYAISGLEFEEAQEPEEETTDTEEADVEQEDTEEDNANEGTIEPIDPNN